MKNLKDKILTALFSFGLLATFWGLNAGDGDVAFKNPFDLGDSVEVTSTEDTITIEQDKVPYDITVNFDEAILNESSQEMKLIVMTQKVSKSYEIEKNGLFNWDIFKQTKAMVFHGLGTYTVDLSNITEEDIVIDNDEKTITISIPKPELTVTINEEETEFFSTSNGLLAWGEMELTPEMNTEIIATGKELLEEELTSDEDVTEMAEKFAKLSVEEIYQPVVNTTIESAIASANDEYAKPVYYTVMVMLKR